MIPTDPLFYVVGFATVFLIAFSKGAFGGGLAILGIPLLALVVDPLDAAVATAILVCVMDLPAIRAFPVSTWSRPDLTWLLPGLAVGIAIGAVVFVAVDPPLVTLVIATVTLAFTAHWFLRGRLDTVARPLSEPRALVFGTLTGFTTFVAHAGGPPLAMYLLPRRLPKEVHAGTTVAMFLIGNFIKLVPYVWIGLARPDALWQSLVLAPMAPVGVAAGRWLHDRLSRDQLYLWCYVLLGLAGLKLFADSVRALA